MTLQNTPVKVVSIVALSLVVTALGYADYQRRVHKPTFQAPVALPSSSCCQSVRLSIVKSAANQTQKTRAGQTRFTKFRLHFTNTNSHNVIAYTLKWMRGTQPHYHTATLFNGVIRTGQSDREMSGQRFDSDSPPELWSLVFEDGSFEGDGASAHYALTAIREAQAIRPDFLAALKGTERSPEAVERFTSLVSARLAKREAKGDTDEPARAFGRLLFQGSLITLQNVKNPKVLDAIERQIERTPHILKEAR